MLKSELLEKLKEINDDTDINETILSIEDFAKSSSKLDGSKLTVGKLDVSKLTIEDYKRILETNEVARLQREAFYSFCKETGVKKVIRHTALDNRVCSDCSPYEGHIYTLEEYHRLDHHILCRCIFDIVD